LTVRAPLRHCALPRCHDRQMLRRALRASRGAAHTFVRIPCRGIGRRSHVGGPASARLARARWQALGAVSSTGCRVQRDARCFACRAMQRTLLKPRSTGCACRGLPCCGTQVVRIDRHSQQGVATATVPALLQDVLNRYKGRRVAGRGADCGGQACRCART